jgi:hypothetical protein
MTLELNIRDLEAEQRLAAREATNISLPRMFVPFSNFWTSKIIFSFKLRNKQNISGPDNFV